MNVVENQNFVLYNQKKFMWFNYHKYSQESTPQETKMMNEYY